ncbi:MAG: hypothetical protein GY773_16205, partial [Actinomycetia bacterium]|nr:hypothetical protein [Actinomycetes bacterium]
VSGIGGDLTAYRSTLLEEGRPWDRPPDPSLPGDTGNSQEAQAAGYATDALAHFVTFLVLREEFIIRFGGMWLLPDAQAETEISGAEYRIWLSSPTNERDDSFLRTLLSKTPDREPDGFLEELRSSERGEGIHSEWQAWAGSCRCTWELGSRVGREFYPTHLTHPTISQGCDVHAMIAACNEYKLILDDAWDQIADWYPDVPKPERRPVTAEELMAKRESVLPAHRQPPPGVGEAGR